MRQAAPLASMMPPMLSLQSTHGPTRNGYPDLVDTVPVSSFRVRCFAIDPLANTLNRSIMTTAKHVYVVYEPIHYTSAVPLRIQQIAGFSHAKLVVLSSGQIEGHGRSKGKGKVYDIWKDGKQEIGFGDNRNRPFKWVGLAAGERFRHLCYTDKSDKELLDAGKRPQVEGLRADADDGV